jgi:rhamnosyltransferase
MKHAIGVRKEHRTPLRTIETSNHSPERRYYMGRNMVLVAREYLTAEPGWVLMKAWKLVKSVILITLFERERSLKVRSLLRGVWHGLRGREGRLEDLS